MLIYHPAYDLYHCAFRLLGLLEALPKRPHQSDKIRILDFYFLFPWLLHKVSLPREDFIFKKVLKSFAETYEQVDDPHKLFIRLEPFQIASLRYLSSGNLIDAGKLAEDKVFRTDKPLPSVLLDAIKQSHSENSQLIDFLIGPFFDIEFYGRKGMKARTKLLESKYDAR